MIISLSLSLLLFFVFQVMSSLLASVAIVGVLLRTSRILASVLIPTDTR